MSGVEPTVPPAKQRASGWFSRWRAARQAAREHERAIAEAVERAVEGTDPRVRAVGSYRRTLAPALARTLAFVDDLVASLPGPLELSRAAWQDDPHVNAFFGTPDDVRQTLTRSKELREFFRREGGTRKAWALLTLTRQEKRVLGMSLQGDVVQREVPQTSVSFVEPRVLAPAPSEAALRPELKRRALNLFVGHAQGRLADLQGRREGLERERQMLQLRLRALRTRGESLAAVDDEAEEIASIERALDENARGLEALGGAVATLDDEVAQVRAVFANPEQHLAMATVAVRVNRMGIKVEGETRDAGSELTLLELSMGPLTRIATLVRCPREEMLTFEAFFGQVHPHLAAQMGIRAGGAGSPPGG